VGVVVVDGAVVVVGVGGAAVDGWVVVGAAVVVEGTVGAVVDDAVLCGVVAAGTVVVEAVVQPPGVCGVACSPGMRTRPAQRKFEKVESAVVEPPSANSLVDTARRTRPWSSIESTTVVPVYPSRSRTWIAASIVACSSGVVPAMRDRVTSTRTR